MVMNTTGDDHPKEEIQAENTHTITSTSEDVVVTSSSAASLPGGVVPPPPIPMSVLALPPPGPALNHPHTSPLNPTTHSQPRNSAAVLVQIEQDIAQLDGEIEDLQLKLAQTVGIQAHQKMNDLFFEHHRCLSTVYSRK